MDLFSGNDFRVYASTKLNELTKEIQGFTDQQITSCDIEEWAKYFESKYSIDPIVLFEDSIERSISETKVKEYNPFYRYGSYEPEYYTKDGYCISFLIPFDGEAELLFLKPSTRILSRFPASDVIKPHGETVGSFTVTFSSNKSDLLAHTNDLSTYVSKQFDSTISGYRTMINNINAEALGFNSGIKGTAKDLLNKRKKKASDFETITRALNIPMTMSKDAPKTFPVELKRINRKPAKKPALRSPEPEYCISHADYNNILNIIHSTCSSMEATARTFVKNSEEEIRDFIIATLGTHYENAVSGETFRKKGKTDIQVIFENKAAFIGECKIWHGIKKFSDAIDQLFGYSTWKDSKSALIVFNKENKDFTSIRNAINQWIIDNTKTVKKRNGNMWECLMYRCNTNTDTMITIALYDLTV